jgi:diadenosine tetraphosphate (Ap4A) HIT family hydrolase
MDENVGCKFEYRKKKKKKSNNLKFLYKKVGQAQTSFKLNATVGSNLGLVPHHHLHLVPSYLECLTMMKTLLVRVVVLTIIMCKDVKGKLKILGTSSSKGRSW